MVRCASYHGRMLSYCSIILIAMTILLLSLLLALSPIPPQSVEADFVQRKTTSLLKEDQVSNGHFSYHAPDYLRWEYISPAPLVWTTENQSTTNPHIQQILQLILRTVNGDYLQENSDFSLSQTDTATYILTPKKRELRQLFSSICIHIVPATGLADQVVLTEKNGDTTTISFNYTH